MAVQWRAARIVSRRQRSQRHRGWLHKRRERRARQAREARKGREVRQGPEVRQGREAA
jgi:hypothetical protein